MVTINEIHTNIRQCTKCELHKTLLPDSTPVPGNGNTQADLMLIGECPGENEVLCCKPFVGLAGQLLDKMLNQADIIRKNCYISNIVKCWCRDGNSNRPVKEEEIKACKRWIWEEMQAVNPKVIVTMGKVPTYTLLNGQLNKTFAMKNVVGQEFTVDYISSVIIPVYHPSFLLQRAKHKIDDTVEIFKKAKSLLISDHDNWANTPPKDKPRKK